MLQVGLSAGEVRPRTNGRFPPARRLFVDRSTQGLARLKESWGLPERPPATGIIQPLISSEVSSSSTKCQTPSMKIFDPTTRSDAWWNSVAPPPPVMTYV